jgi:hypothetical protein
MHTSHSVRQSYDIHVGPTQLVHSLGSRDAVVLAAVTGVGEKTSSPHAPEDARGSLQLFSVASQDAPTLTTNRISEQSNNVWQQRTVHSVLQRSAGRSFMHAAIAMT